MGEAGKQIGDQSAHFIWGLATGAIQCGPAWGIWVASHGTGQTLGALAIGVLLAAGSWAFWTLREGKQREGELQHDGTYRGTGSHTPWDPYLDTGIFAFAFAVGTVLMAGAFLKWGM